MDTTRTTGTTTSDKEIDMKIIINGADFECLHLTERIKDYTWDMRDNIELLMPMTHTEADELFKDGIAWGYIPNGAEELIDCSAYSVAGDITDHRDGTVSVRMGKPTQADLLAEELADAKAALALLGVTDEPDEQEETNNDVY